MRYWLGFLLCWHWMEVYDGFRSGRLMVDPSKRIRDSNYPVLKAMTSNRDDLQNRIVFYNTLTRKKEKFVPISQGKVSFYSCGPTVYDFAHIGNFRAFLTYDLIKRWLQYCGYDVNHICNLTDVDDKIILRMIQENSSLQQITAKYTNAFFRDLALLNIRRANHYPKATEYIDKMIEMISQLQKDGFAYEENGSIYFQVKKAKQYGQLAQLKEVELDEQLVVGAGDSGPNQRRGTDDKRNSRDFALWKAYTEQDKDVKWDTILGPGRPGWHIECSAMCHSLLGDTIDLHGGGIDLIFPHHSNEIAQSEAFTGQKFCNYWIHNGFVNINQEKMSKSLKNFKTLRDIVSNPLDARAFRFLVITAQYRNPLNFNEETFMAAKNSLKRIDKVMHRIQAVIDTNNNATVTTFEKMPMVSSELQASIQTARQEIEAYLSDDLNTPRAIASYFMMIQTIEKYLQQWNSYESYPLEVIKSIQYFQQELLALDEIFGFFYSIETEQVHNHSFDDNCNCLSSTGSQERDQEVFETVKALADQRLKLKREKRYQESDQLRQEILALGYVIKDKKDGYELLKS